ncbi:MAG: hypothetical protein PHN80_06015 [Hespellia sp.]|nr:hypothetical protein [Hespellia sp.]
MRAISAEEVQILIVSGLIGAVVGGSGLTGIVFYFIRRYIENKLNAKDAEQKKQNEIKHKDEMKRREQRIKRLSVDDELQHCEGRLFFWIHKAIVDGNHNGDLENAFSEYQKAEQEKKLLDREIITENEFD